MSPRFSATQQLRSVSVAFHGLRTTIVGSKISGWGGSINRLVNPPWGDFVSCKKTAPSCVWVSILAFGRFWLVGLGGALVQEIRQVSWHCAALGQKRVRGGGRLGGRRDEWFHSGPPGFRSGRACPEICGNFSRFLQGNRVLYGAEFRWPCITQRLRAG